MATSLFADEMRCLVKQFNVAASTKKWYGLNKWSNVFYNPSKVQGTAMKFNKKNEKKGIQRNTGANTYKLRSQKI